MYPNKGAILEERAESEVLTLPGRDHAGAEAIVRLGSEGTRAFNPAFDVTPATLVTALITEFGVVEPTALTSLRKR